MLSKRRNSRMLIVSRILVAAIWRVARLGRRKRGSEEFPKFFKVGNGKLAGKQGLVLLDSFEDFLERVFSVDHVVARIHLELGRIANVAHIQQIEELQPDIGGNILELLLNNLQGLGLVISVFGKVGRSGVQTNKQKKKKPKKSLGRIFAYSFFFEKPHRSKAS